LKGSKPADVQELQEKLQRLRKEQQEADAARDKAWKQLKVRTAFSLQKGHVCLAAKAMYRFSKRHQPVACHLVSFI
jgi:YesN/AraC family two-component response regulator